MTDATTDTETEAEAPPKRAHYYYLDGKLVGVSFDGPPEGKHTFPKTARDFREFLAARRGFNWWDVLVETTERGADRG